MMGNYLIRQEIITPDPWACSLCVVCYALIDFQRPTYSALRKVSPGSSQVGFCFLKKKRPLKYIVRGKSFRL